MEKRIKICKISPINDGLINWGPVHAKSISEIAHDDIELVQIDLPSVEIKSISSSYESELVAVEATKAALNAEAEGFDAVVIGCLLEPGVSAAKELLRIPVVGFAQASLHLASLTAHSFSFIVSGINNKSNRALYDIVRQYGFIDHLASIRSAGFSPLAFTRADEEPQLIKKMLSEAINAIKEDGAEAIIGYGGYEVIKVLREELPVPVINPIQASILIAELLVRAKIAQSKVAFG
jgi:allantoin racemase